MPRTTFWTCRPHIFHFMNVGRNCWCRRPGVTLPRQCHSILKSAAMFVPPDTSRDLACVYELPRVRGAASWRDPVVLSLQELQSGSANDGQDALLEYVCRVCKSPVVFK